MLHFEIPEFCPICGEELFEEPIAMVHAGVSLSCESESGKIHYTLRYYNDNQDYEEDITFKDFRIKNLIDFDDKKFAILSPEKKFRILYEGAERILFTSEEQIRNFLTIS